MLNSYDTEYSSNYCVKKEKSRLKAALKSRIGYMLSLTRFKARLSFINNIYSALAAHDTTVAVARF